MNDVPALNVTSSSQALPANVDPANHASPTNLASPNELLPMNVVREYPLGGESYLPFLAGVGDGVTALRLDDLSAWLLRAVGVTL